MEAEEMIQYECMVVVADPNPTLLHFSSGARIDGQWNNAYFSLVRGYSFCGHVGNTAGYWPERYFYKDGVKLRSIKELITLAAQTISDGARFNSGSNWRLGDDVLECGRISRGYAQGLRTSSARSTQSGRRRRKDTLRHSGESERMKKPIEDPTSKQFHDLLTKAATTVVPTATPERTGKPASSSIPQAGETSGA
jgi:hypothetical protein